MAIREVADVHLTAAITCSFCRGSAKTVVGFHGEIFLLKNQGFLPLEIGGVASLDVVFVEGTNHLGVFTFLVFATEAY